MNFLTIAYPQLSKKDYELIQSFRKQHDESYYKIVEPHFTFVFAVAEMLEEDFVKEIKKQLDGVQAINFVIRCATISKDSFSDHYHIFLVPDEGYSLMVKLHDKLYSERLKEELLLDIDFIPHIGIGRLEDKINCKAEVDKWNETILEIKGSINAIDIISYDNETVNTLEKITLK